MNLGEAAFDVVCESQIKMGAAAEQIINKCLRAMKMPQSLFSGLIFVWSCGFFKKQILTGIFLINETLHVWT